MHPTHLTYANGNLYPRDPEEMRTQAQSMPGQAGPRHKQQDSPQSLYHKQASPQLIDLGTTSPNPQKYLGTYNFPEHDPPSIDGHDFVGPSPAASLNSMGGFGGSYPGHSHRLRLSPRTQYYNIPSQSAHYLQTGAGEQTLMSPCTPRGNHYDGGYTFGESPGYNWVKNKYNLLDCHENCGRGRCGKRGFKRRGNLLVHLRNCHNQNIPKRDPGGPRKRVRLVSRPITSF